MGMRHARRRRRGRWLGRITPRARVRREPVCISAAPLALPAGPVWAPVPELAAEPVVEPVGSNEEASGDASHEGSSDGIDVVSKQVELHEVLRGFHDAVDGVHGAVLATRDGLPVASTLAEARTDTVAAMAATVVALASQAAPSTDDDADGHTVIRGSDGCLVVYAAGDLGVLAVQTSAHPNIGLVQVEAPAAARQLAALLA